MTIKLMFIVFLNSYLNNFVIWLRSCYAGAGICSFLILSPSKRKVLLMSGTKLGCISQGSISSMMIIDSLEILFEIRTKKCQKVYEDLYKEMTQLLTRDHFREKSNCQLE
ncbi:unnamed protein product [Brassica rapa]|uniref:Uncharacterized protein n=2 Tax=Brassica TaxID=3705 RepID=A0A8D9HP32_BRACM|nr:unnamed protein product [Brassica napus]CAG7903273.1 unnamed protein product [Brassica rapa]